MTKISLKTVGKDLLDITGVGMAINAYREAEKKFGKEGGTFLASGALLLAIGIGILGVTFLPESKSVEVGVKTIDATKEGNFVKDIGLAGKGGVEKDLGGAADSTLARDTGPDAAGKGGEKVGDIGIANRGSSPPTDTAVEQLDAGNTQINPQIGRTASNGTSQIAKPEISALQTSVPSSVRLSAETGIEEKGIPGVEVKAVSVKKKISDLPRLKVYNQDMKIKLESFYAKKYPRMSYESRPPLEKMEDKMYQEFVDFQRAEKDSPSTIRREQYNFLKSQFLKEKYPDKDIAEGFNMMEDNGSVEGRKMYNEFWYKYSKDYE
jgi:hypothetical protein